MTGKKGLQGGEARSTTAKARARTAVAVSNAAKTHDRHRQNTLVLESLARPVSDASHHYTNYQILYPLHSTIAIATAPVRSRSALFSLPRLSACDLTWLFDL